MGLSIPKLFEMGSFCISAVIRCLFVVIIMTNNDIKCSCLCIFVVIDPLFVSVLCKSEQNITRETNNNSFT